MGTFTNILNEIKDPVLYVDVFAEFLGTFLLLFIGSSTFMNSHESFNAGSTFGLILIGLITVFSERGGCHLNPAISMAHFISHRIHLIRFIFYVMAQHCGSISGTILINVLTNHSFDNTVNEPNIANSCAVLIEGILTFILVLIIFTVKNNLNSEIYNGVMLGVAVGVTVFVFHIGFKEISGASMNPARSFGPAIYYKKTNHIWIYYVGPILGSVAGTLFYDTILAKNISLKKLKEYFTNKKSQKSDNKVVDLANIGF